MVFDQPDFSGNRDFINGPAKYLTLRSLPFGANWRQRIRSAQTGQAARVVFWTNEQLRGTALVLGPESRRPTLAVGMDARVQSMEIQCLPSAPS